MGWHCRAYLRCLGFCGLIVLPAEERGKEHERESNSKPIRQEPASRDSTPAYCSLVHALTMNCSTMAPASDDSSSSSNIRITVLFFASAREAAGNISQTQLEVRNGCDTKELRCLLAERFPKLASMVMDEDSVTFALNEEFVPPGQVCVLHSGDTIALIPPISGG